MNNAGPFDTITFMRKKIDKLQTQARATNALVASLRHTLRSTTHVTRAAILNRLSLLLSRYDHSIGADAKHELFATFFDDKSKPVQDPRYQHYVDTMITAGAKPHSYDAWARVAGTVIHCVVQRTRRSANNFFGLASRARPRRVSSRKNDSRNATGFGREAAQ